MELLSCNVMYSNRVCRFITNFFNNLVPYSKIIFRISKGTHLFIRSIYTYFEQFFCYKHDMKSLLAVLSVGLFLSSCATFTSGLIIPAHQTFLLGEFNDKNYSANLINRSNLTVIIKAVDKYSGEITQRFGLSPLGRTKV